MEKGCSLEKLYILFAIILGILYCLVFPPFVIGDEYTHFFTAYRYSDAIMGYEDIKLESSALGVQGIDTFRIVVRESEADLMGWTENLTSKSYEFYDGFKVFNGDNENRLTTIDVTTANYFPVPFYCFEIAAIIISRILGLSSGLMILLARFANYAFFVYTGYWSIRGIPIMKKMMCVLYLLPLSIQEAMSCSYNSVMYALVFFFIAWVTSMMYSDEMISKKKYIGLFCLSLLIAPAKGYLIFLIFLILLIPKEKFGNKSAFTSCFLILACCIILWLLYNISVVNASEILRNNDAGRFIEWSSAEGITVGDIMTHPFHYISLIVKTIAERGFYLMPSMVGLRVNCGALFQYIVFMIFGISLLGDANERTLPIKSKLFFGLIYVPSYCLLSVLTMLSFMGKDLSIIELKGAYLLVLLPVLGFCFNNQIIEVKKDISNFLAICMFVTNLLIVGNIHYYVVRG